MSGEPDRDQTGCGCRRRNAQVKDLLGNPQAVSRSSFTASSEGLQDFRVSLKPTHLDNTLLGKPSSSRLLWSFLHLFQLLSHAVICYSTIMASNLSPDTLDPLPSILQHGLLAVSSLGLLSLFSSTALLSYLSYKFFTWRLRGDLGKGCNQFLLLIFNLLLADIQQATAFVLTLVWLEENRIDAKSATCFVEGWFVSTGDLASSIWIFAIALHTFYAVVKERRLPTGVFTTIAVGLWVFIYAIAAVGVALHPRDYYVRAGAWVCYLNYPLTADLTNTVLGQREIQQGTSLAPLLLDLPLHIRDHPCLLFHLHRTTISDTRPSTGLKQQSCAAIDVR